MSQFKDKVIKVVKMVPRGKVVSYGQVAAYVGAPRAAQQVGWILRSIETTVELPWWRVVNNAGRLTIKGNLYNDQPLQKKLLEDEGIKIAKDYTFEINKYRFYPNDSLLKEMELEDAYVKTLHGRYF